MPAGIDDLTHATIARVRELRPPRAAGVCAVQERALGNGIHCPVVDHRVDVTGDGRDEMRRVRHGVLSPRRTIYDPHQVGPAPRECDDVARRRHRSQDRRISISSDSRRAAERLLDQRGSAKPIHRICRRVPARIRDRSTDDGRVDIRAGIGGRSQPGRRIDEHRPLPRRIPDGGSHELSVGAHLRRSLAGELPREIVRPIPGAATPIVPLGHPVTAIVLELDRLATLTASHTPILDYREISGAIDRDRVDATSRILDPSQVIAHVIAERVRFADRVGNRYQQVRPVVSERRLADVGNARSGCPPNHPTEPAAKPPPEARRRSVEPVAAKGQHPQVRVEADGRATRVDPGVGRTGRILAGASGLFGQCREVAGR